MQKLKRVRELLTAITIRDALNVFVRLSLATVVNYLLSQLLFNKKLVPVLQEAFKASHLWELRIFEEEADRLPKMLRLWPPLADIRLTAVFTTTLYILLRSYLRPEYVWQLLERRRRDQTARTERRRSAIVAYLLSAGVVAIILFVLLLPLQRLAEMHVFVIVLNLIHTILVCEITAIAMFAYTESGNDKVKEE